MVPIKYNVRSLRARKVGSLMTIFGIGMVVWASIFAFGLSAGLDRTLEIAAEPLDVIVLRKGSTSEAVSAVTESAAREIKALSGIATDPAHPDFSGEFVSAHYAGEDFIGAELRVKDATGQVSGLPVMQIRLVTVSEGAHLLVTGGVSVGGGGIWTVVCTVDE